MAYGTYPTVDDSTKAFPQVVREAFAGSIEIRDRINFLADIAIASGESQPARYAKVVALGKLPNFTRLGVMSFPDGLRVISGRDWYTIAPGTLDYSSILKSTSVALILLNKTTSSLVAVGVTSLAAVHGKMILVGICTSGSRGRTAWLSGPYTFEGTYTPENHHEILFASEVPGAKVTPTLVNGEPTQVRHEVNGNLIRYDTYSSTSTTFVEVRKHIPSGDSVTLTTNLVTYITEVSYS